MSNSSFFSICARVSKLVVEHDVSYHDVGGKDAFLQKLEELCDKRPIDDDRMTQLFDEDEGAIEVWLESEYPLQCMLENIRLFQE